MRANYADRRKPWQEQPLSKHRNKRAAQRKNRAAEIAAENIRLGQVASDLLLQIDAIREMVSLEQHQPAQ
jgi:hypothetical protein